MNFEQWIEEMSKGELIRRDEKGDSGVLSRANAFSYEDLEGDEPPGPELKEK